MILPYVHDKIKDISRMICTINEALTRLRRFSEKVNSICYTLQNNIKGNRIMMPFDELTDHLRELRDCIERIGYTLDDVSRETKAVDFSGETQRKIVEITKERAAPLINMSARISESIARSLDGNFNVGFFDELFLILGKYLDEIKEYIIFLDQYVNILEDTRQSLEKAADEAEKFEILF